MVRVGRRRARRLRDWYVDRFGLRSLLFDLRRRARVARSVEQWMRDPKRWDIPGVDAPRGRRGRLRGRQLTLTGRRGWLRLPRRRRSQGVRKGGRRPSGYEGELARRIWEGMRDHKGYTYMHARALARRLMGLGVDPETIDYGSFDYSLEYGELVGELERRYRSPRRTIYDKRYMEYVESTRNWYREYSMSLREPEPWELAYMDEALF